MSVLAMGTNSVYAYEAEDSVYGDVNGDWRVTSTDYLLIKKIFQGQTVTAKVKARADIDYNGKITSTDYLTLKRIFTGQPIPEYKKTLAPQDPVNDPGNRIVYSVSSLYFNMVCKVERSSMYGVGAIMWAAISTVSSWEKNAMRD